MVIKFQQEQMLIGANIAIILLVLITLMVSVNAWRSDWQLTHQVIQPLTMTSVNQQAALIDQLPELHVFGKPLEVMSEVPISSLELHVTGIAKISGQANPSKAYIAISNQPSKIYRIGDTVNGVKLYDITEDAVVLENKGRLEKLPLQRNKLEFKTRETPRR